MSCVHVHIQGEKKTLKHMHFKLWPNYKVVENISHLVHLVKAVHKQHRGNTSEHFADNFELQ